MKLIQESVRVELDAKRSPQRLSWRGKLYCITSINETWLYAGEWWKTPNLQGRFRIYYCVQAMPVADPCLTMEIFEEAGVWTLSRLLD